MEIICKKELLTEGVQKVEKIISTRTTLPIIGNVLFEASLNILKMSANNLEIGIEVNIAAKVIKEGSVLIPAKTLAGIVYKLPNTDICIKTSDKGIVSISYGSSSFNIHGLAPDEFPLLPKVKDAKKLIINNKIFNELIKSTIFAVSSSEDKYILNGVLLEVGKIEGPSNIRMISTDGYRLAKRGVKLPSVPAAASSLIVPSKALAEVSRIIGESDGDVEINIGTEQISFKYNNCFIVSRIIQGQFPNYKQVIPKSSTIKLTIKTKEFLESSERASVIATTSANIVRLDVRGAKMHIIANTPEVGSVDEVVDIIAGGVEKIQIAFNVKLITDVLKVLDSDKVILELSSPLNPGIIRPADDLDYIYIIMPIRTSDVGA